MTRTMKRVSGWKKAKDKIKEMKGEASNGVLVVEDIDEGTRISNVSGNDDGTSSNAANAIGC